MTAEVPEIKLNNITLKKNNTLMRRHYVCQTLFYCFYRKATALQQKSNLFKLFSIGLKEKNKLMNFLSVLTLLFINF